MYGMDTKQEMDVVVDDAAKANAKVRLVLLGPPGAGKGTQADFIAKSHGIPQISTGDMFRQAVTQGTELGRRAKEFMDAGLLVPDEVVIGIVRERLDAPDCRDGFILDGFPRTTAQAEELDGVLKDLGAGLTAVLNFVVPEEILVRRLTLRRTCGECGRIYHLENNPPRTPGKCDACGGELIQRSDDTEGTVRRRLEVYRTQTQPLIDFYERRGLLVDLDGAKPVETVRAQIVAKLGGARAANEA